MYKIISSVTREIIAEGLSQNEAIKQVGEMYAEQGIDRSSTGIGILCDYSVKALRRSELDFILDKVPNFFLLRTYDNEQGAFIVTEEEYNFILNNNERYLIVNE